MRVSARIRTATILGIAALASTTASAQSRLAAFVSSAFGDGGPAPAFGVSAAYPVWSGIRLEAEATFVRKLDFGTYQSCPPSVFCVAIVSFPFTLTANAASLGGNVVAELPWHTPRIRPYLVGGAGIARVRREQRERRFDGSTILTARASTRPLVTAGAGVEFLLGRRIALAADARYQRMYEDDPFGRIDIRPTLGLVRIGSAIGYRF
jgi:hypothetical protein